MRLTALVALLVVAMVASTLLQGAVGVLSIFIIDEFDISRSAFGLAFAAYSLVGGLSSLYMGALADRDSRRVLLGLFAMAGLGFVGAATAPTFIVLIIAMMLGGVALGAGNPVTNRILAEHIPVSRRGSVIGLKQAGPLLGIFLAGAVLPPIALAFGWRTALGLTVVLPLVGFVAALVFRPRRKLTITQSSGIRELEGDVRFVVYWLSALGFGVSVSTSGLIAFLPLFAQESGGQTPTVAGAIAATMGLAGVVGRIGWGFFGGRFHRPTTALMIIGTISVISISSVAYSEVGGVVWLWFGAVGSGFSVLAWHSVAWLVIVDRVGLTTVGRASGVMQMGTTFGFALGAVLIGLLLDLSESYALVWSFTAGLMAIVTIATGYPWRQASARIDAET